MKSVKGDGILKMRGETTKTKNERPWMRRVKESRSWDYVNCMTLK